MRQALVHKSKKGAKRGVRCVELHDETRTVRLSRRGKRLRDYEYKRGGTANVFVMTEPKAGRHNGRVTKRRTRRDFA